MAVTCDKMFKRKVTGGLRLPWHKKRAYAAGRPAAMTKVHIVKSTTANAGAKKVQKNPKKVRTIRCRGGNQKFRALRLSEGNFSWAGVNINCKSRINSVCYNTTSNELVRTNTLVKSCIVYIDSKPFQDKYEQFSQDKLSEAQKQHIKAGADNAVIEQFKTNKLLAKITTRPGQCGKADGYVLEGPELQFYLKKLQTK